jgi:Cytidine and deoxycytidylate deaminase zinc-binding region
MGTVAALRAKENKSSSRWSAMQPMSLFDRRRFANMALGSFAILFPMVRATAALDAKKQMFVAEAARMKREAITSGDQPFGAVVVMGDTIVGYGPSRVLIDRNPNAHAERVALWDAQRRLGNRDLSGAVIYSTSRPAWLVRMLSPTAILSGCFLGRRPPTLTNPDAHRLAKTIIKYA